VRTAHVLGNPIVSRHCGPFALAIGRPFGVASLWWSATPTAPEQGGSMNELTESLSLNATVTARRAEFDVKHKRLAASTLSACNITQNSTLFTHLLFPKFTCWNRLPLALRSRRSGLIDGSAVVQRTTRRFHVLNRDCNLSYCH
jgi:hypothetical protein